MSRQQNNSIGKAELELLQFVHDRHPVTVRDAADHLAASRGIVRTTVLNMMSRLVQKGFLSRKRIGGIYHYAPRIPQQNLLKNLIRSFVHDTLGGSVSPFVAYLAQEAKDGAVSPEELAELKKLVNDLEKKDKP